MPASGALAQAKMSAQETPPFLIASLRCREAFGVAARPSIAEERRVLCGA
jgi:hypothetical protein